MEGRKVKDQLYIIDKMEPVFLMTTESTSRCEQSNEKMPLLARVKTSRHKTGVPCQEAIYR